jgi:hypothetical protein
MPKSAEWGEMTHEGVGAYAVGIFTTFDYGKGDGRTATGERRRAKGDWRKSTLKRLATITVL